MAMNELKLSARAYLRPDLESGPHHRRSGGVRAAHIGAHLRSHPVSFARPAVVGVNTDLAKLEESDAGKAQRLVGELLREAGWMEGKLNHRPKGEIKKARIATWGCG